MHVYACIRQQVNMATRAMQPCLVGRECVKNADAAKRRANEDRRGVMEWKWCRNSEQPRGRTCTNLARDTLKKEKFDTRMGEGSSPSRHATHDYAR